MFTRLALLTALAAALAKAQNPARSSSIVGCTTNSFAIPSWFIQDFHLVGSGSSSGNRSVSFHALNRATNYTADVACQAGNDGWNTCSVDRKAPANESFHAAIQIKGSSAEIKVNETWNCDDRKGFPSLDFEAVGSSSFKLNCQNTGGNGQSCEATSSPLLIRGSLLAPVAITPAYAEGPSGHDTPGCAAKAQNPSWTISTLYYSNEEADGVAATPSENLFFHLTNPTIDYEAGCMASAFPTPQNPKPAQSQLTCSGNEFGSLSTDRYRLATQGVFEPAGFRFSFNQTWYCDDVDPAKPLKITASASESISLSCTSVVSEGASAGNITTCVNTADIPIKGKLVSEELLPPYSIQDPIPPPDGCTVSSIFSPKWIFSAFEIDSDATAAASGGNSSSVSFNVILQTSNRGFQFPISISQDSPAPEGSWYKCAIGAGGDTGQILWPSDCTFRYIPDKQELSLKANWICNDIDPYHPIVFSGITTTTINSSLACSTTNGVSQCRTTDTGYSWIADISDVKWRAA